MTQRTATRVSWTNAADLVLLLLLVASLSVGVTGGIEATVWDLPISVTSVPRLLLFAAIVVVIRHLIAPRPSLVERIAALLSRPVTAALCVVAVATLCVISIASARVVQEVTRVGDERLRYGLFAELQPTPLMNCRLERFGEPHDGGYLMCGNLMQGVKSAYSYGINGYDQWGCDVSTRAEVGVHEYDCFDTRRPSCPRGRLVFHDECVAGARHVEEGRLFDTVKNQIERNGDANRRLVVKIDVEGAEWESLPATPESTLQRIDQMAVEFHSIDARSLPVIRKLKALFYVAHLHFNNISCMSRIRPFPAWAYEVLLVNKRIGEPDRSISRYLALAGEAAHVFRPPAPPASPLDAPNAPDLPDCQPK